MGLHRDLRLDSIVSKPYTEEEIERLANFAEEIATEKINGEFYVTGVPYTADKINSTVLAMSADPIAYSLATLDKYHGKVTEADLKHKAFFTTHYLNPAKSLVNQILAGKPVTTELICNYAHISADDLQKAKATMAKEEGSGMPYFLQQQMKKQATASATTTATHTTATASATAKKPDAVGRPTKIKAPAKKEDRKPLTKEELAALNAQKLR